MSRHETESSAALFHRGKFPAVEPREYACAYSGRLNVRMSKDLHRRLALESATQGVSLNNWITTKLSR